MHSSRKFSVEPRGIPRTSEADRPVARIEDNDNRFNSSGARVYGGMDDNQLVDFRYTVTLGDSVSTRLKEFRRRGQPWEYRHEYRLRRVPQ